MLTFAFSADLYGDENGAMMDGQGCELSGSGKADTEAWRHLAQTVRNHDLTTVDVYQVVTIQTEYRSTGLPKHHRLVRPVAQHTTQRSGL